MKKDLHITLSRTYNFNSESLRKELEKKGMENISDKEIEKLATEKSYETLIGELTFFPEVVSDFVSHKIEYDNTKK